MLHLNNICLVIGNGPSLKDVPDSFLKKYVTFGTNRIYLRFTPTYYVAINPLVIRQNKADIEALDCVKFVRAGMGVTGTQLKSKTSPPFSFEPLEWIHEGYTVTYVCLQLAYWLNFQTVLLVGVDHRYEYEGKPNEKRIMSGDDPNHFDPAYFKGQEWNNPDLAKSESYYQTAKEVYEADGRRIVNLTPNTGLHVFEKGSIEEWK